MVSKRPDGYHNIETVFYPVNLQDVLEINLMKPLDTALDKGGQMVRNTSLPRIGKQKSDAGPLRKLIAETSFKKCPADSDACFADRQVKIELKGNALPGNPEENLVVKAYRMMLEDFELPPVEISLFKHIPSGAGLGGGSSDCASMIMLLNRRFGLRLTQKAMERYASKLGADCAFFVRNTPVLATGIGNEMASVDLSLKGYSLLMVKPDIEVSTREAYSLVVPGRPEIALADAILRPVSEWKNCIFNDFEKSIFSIHPEIGCIKEQLYDMGALYAAMSGSGSTVYGIFAGPVENPEPLFPGSACFQRTLL